MTLKGHGWLGGEAGRRMFLQPLAHQSVCAMARSSGAPRCLVLGVVELVVGHVVLAARVLPRGCESDVMCVRVSKSVCEC